MLQSVASVSEKNVRRSPNTFRSRIPLKGIDTTQHTIRKTTILKGVGVHSDQPVTLKVKPALAHTGYLFIRTDLRENNCIPARWDTVIETSFCTKIGNEQGVTVSTIEHLMAALRAVGIHNAVIEINGPEVPIMDGSSVQFIDTFLQKGGIKSLKVPLRKIRVLKPIRVTQKKGWATLSPSDEPRISIYFDANGRLSRGWNFDYRPEREDFLELISEARTFGFLEDALILRSQGLAKGADLSNTVVLDGDQILNTEGLRFDDELVRHKILDAYGDLMLAGGRLLGHFQGYNSGHGLNNLLLHALFQDQEAWVYE